MSLLKKVLSALLIIFGSFCEVMYICYRYKADGIILPICIIIGLSLNVFLMLAVYEKKKSLTVALIVFSIINTSSGQTLSMLKKENAERKTPIVNESGEQIARYKKDIAQLDTEIMAISKRLNGFESMEEKAEYKNNVREDENALTNKRTEKARLEALIDTTAKDIKQETETSVEADSVYTFYGSIPKWKLKEWITFILHTILSFFISIMAPFGISTLEKVMKEVRLEAVEKEKQEPAQLSTNSYTLDDWITWAWYLAERRERKEMPSPKAMEEYAYLAHKEWDGEKHIEYIKMAEKAGLIDNMGKLYGSAENARNILKNAK